MCKWVITLIAFVFVDPAGAATQKDTLWFVQNSIFTQVKDGVARSVFNINNGTDLAPVRYYAEPWVIDADNGLIYWIYDDAYTKHLYRTNVDGTGTTLVRDLNQPHLKGMDIVAMVLVRDSGTLYMYANRVTSSEPLEVVVMRMKGDGSGYEEFHAASPGLLFGLALDADDGYLYLALDDDRGRVTSFYRCKLECTTLEDLGLRFDTQFARFRLDSTANELYVTAHGKIFRVRIDTIGYPRAIVFDASEHPDIAEDVFGRPSYDFSTGTIYFTSRSWSDFRDLTAYTFYRFHIATKQLTNMGLRLANDPNYTGYGSYAMGLQVISGSGGQERTLYTQNYNTSLYRHDLQASTRTSFAPGTARGGANQITVDDTAGYVYYIDDVYVSFREGDRDIISRRDPLGVGAEEEVFRGQKGEEFLDVAVDGKGQGLFFSLDSGSMDPLGEKKGIYRIDLTDLHQLPQRVVGELPSAMAIGDDGFLYWSVPVGAPQEHVHTFHRMDVATGAAEYNLVTVQGQVTSMEIGAQSIYYSGEYGIFRLDLTTNQETYIATQTVRYTGFSLDQANGHVYYNHDGDVMRADVDGQDKNIVVIHASVGIGTGRSFALYQGAISQDTDGDGTEDPLDPDVHDPSRCGDRDNDTCDDCSNRGMFDPFPLGGDPSRDGLDTDQDGLCDAGDDDDDNDRVGDLLDRDSLDPSICRDADRDLCDDCSRPRDGLGPQADYDTSNDGEDIDGDGLCDLGDLDDDNDGVADAIEQVLQADPLDPSTCGDRDNDTCDDCAVFIDGFGPGIDFDVFADGPDQDRDGACDLGDDDVDGDGIANEEDGCPLGPNTDVDKDGILDCVDTDADGNGTDDVLESLPGSQNIVELAGNTLDSFPHFEYVNVFNQGADVHVAIDPAKFPDLVGSSVSVYVVAARTQQEWEQNRVLEHVVGEPVEVTVQASSVTDNIVLVSSGHLAGEVAQQFGRPYDVVVDVDQDGILTGVDYIDGWKDRAGFAVVPDITQEGPYRTATAVRADKEQVIYYPQNISGLGQVPLIVISHGSGHHYTWYGYLAHHLASYGYIVMSHKNETIEIHDAAVSTVDSTSDVIKNLTLGTGIIANGLLDGHVDRHRIAWIGHSRGGEGVVFAYNAMASGAFNVRKPTFTTTDIRLVSSIAPSNEKNQESLPGYVPYHLLTLSGDDDVTGSVGNNDNQTYQIFERAMGFRLSTTLQGAGHSKVLDPGVGLPMFQGPCELGRSTVHGIVKGLYLPLLEYFVKDRPFAGEFLWRQYERFHPIGVATENPCVVVTHDYRNGHPQGNLIVDDFQTGTARDVSSSGGKVFISSGLSPIEGIMADRDNSFVWTESDHFNGATQDTVHGDVRGVALGWQGTQWIEWEIVASQRDFSRYKYFSFRGAQVSRHPFTQAVHGDLVFDVTLVDMDDNHSTISIGAYGGGLEQPYGRSGETHDPTAKDIGWHNEMESIRIRLDDFATDGTIDLANIRAIRFEFGNSGGSPEGQILLDDLLLTQDRL